MRWIQAVEANNEADAEREWRYLQISFRRRVTEASLLCLHLLLLSSPEDHFSCYTAHFNSRDVSEPLNNHVELFTSNMATSSRSSLHAVYSSFSLIFSLLSFRFCFLCLSLTLQTSIETILLWWVYNKCVWLLQVLMMILMIFTFFCKAFKKQLRLLKNDTMLHSHKQTLPDSWSVDFSSTSCETYNKVQFSGSRPVSSPVFTCSHGNESFPHCVDLCIENIVSKLLGFVWALFDSPGDDTNIFLSFIVFICGRSPNSKKEVRIVKKYITSSSFFFFTPALIFFRVHLYLWHVYFISVKKEKSQLIIGVVHSSVDDHELNSNLGPFSLKHI